MTAYPARGAGLCHRGHPRPVGAGRSCTACNRDRRRWTRVGHLFDALLADLAADGPTLTERRKVLGL